MKTLLIEKAKRHDGRGRWGSYVVAEDEDGLWRYTPRGSTYRATQGGVTSTCTAGDPTPPGVPVLHLIPREAWWFARWQISRAGVSTLSIDICTPATFDGRVWEYIDLELDLFKSSDGIVGIFDQDEFDEAVAGGEITEAEKAHCLEVAAGLNERIQQHDRLFDDLAWQRFAEVCHLDVPSIVELD